jgi:site-specific DNA recombinase
MPNHRSTSSRRESQKERPSEGASRARIRCAIYTRKSSEEGLEQEFNSLDG